MKKLENKIMLITYADSLGNNLKQLNEVLDKYYQKAIGGVHVLPFFPSSADRGFAPMRYDMVDPSFGTFDDLKQMSEKYYLMYDFMINHISKQSQQFQDFQQKKMNLNIMTSLFDTRISGKVESPHSNKWTPFIRENPEHLILM